MQDDDDESQHSESPSKRSDNPNDKFICVDDYDCLDEILCLEKEWLDFFEYSMDLAAANIDHICSR